MTELSPLGTLGDPKPASLGGRTRPPGGFRQLPAASGSGSSSSGPGSDAAFRRAYLGSKLKQGRPHVLCDMRIVDDGGRELPHDGQSVGHLQVGVGMGGWWVGGYTH